MHLLIRTDGRTERYPDYDIYDDQRNVFRTLNQTSDMGREFGPQHCLPIRAGQWESGRAEFTMWIAEPTLSGVGLRNVPASLLAAQWGIPLRVLCGPVVVTSSGSGASAFVEDVRWSYVESLTVDIVRAIGGLNPLSHVDAAWPQAIRLAAAVLDDAPRPQAMGLTGDAALNYLLADLGVVGAGDDR
jgi:hypothetical protein